MNTHRSCALVAGALLACACAENPRSCDLETSALVMLATVSDTDAGVEVEVEFETATATGTPIALCPGTDVLTVNGVEATEVLALGHLYYEVEFEDAAAQFEILLTRKGNDPDKVDVDAVVEMPPSFELDAPSEASEHSRAVALDVNWAPAWPDHQIELAVEDKIGSTCIEGLGYDDLVVDNGSSSVPGGTLVSGDGGGSCEVKISLTRVLEAPYPEVLAPGGSLTAIVNRRRPFRSID